MLPLLKGRFPLGLKPRTFNPLIPHFSSLRMKLHLAGELPHAPLAADYTQKLPPSLGMMENDRLGDCAEAGFFHFMQVWSANAASIITVPDGTVQQLYTDGAGYDPNAAPVDGQNPTDEGTVLQELLAFLLNTGALMPDGSRHKITAFFEVDPTKPGDLDLVTAECGAIYLGFSVPAYLPENPGSVWDVNAKADNTIVGDHCVISARYNPQQRGIISWGSPGYAMTPAFWGQRVTECYAIVDPLFVAATGKTPFGIDLATWSDQMAGLKQQPDQVRAALNKAIDYIAEFHELDGARKEDEAFLEQLRAVAGKGAA